MAKIAKIYFMMFCELVQDLRLTTSTRAFRTTSLRLEVMATEETTDFHPLEHGASINGKFPSYSSLILSSVIKYYVVVKSLSSCLRNRLNCSIALR